MTKRKGWLLRIRAISVLVLSMLVAVIATASEDPSQNTLETGRRAFAAGDYKQAEVFFRKSVAEAENEGAPDAMLALRLDYLANVLLSQGKLEEAEFLLDRAVSILRSHPAGNKRQLPVVLGSLGKIYQQTGRVERSEATLQEALQLGRKLLAEEPLYLSDLYNNLGVLQIQTGKRKQAENSFKTALTLVEKSLTDTYSRKAAILANLSSLYFVQQNWSLAEQTLLRSIDIVERTQGPSHPNICALLDNLGILYVRQHDMVRAESALRRELAIRIAVFGSENASTAQAEATLAEVLAAQGKYDEAGSLFTEALNTQERVLGRAPQVATTLEQFAAVLRLTNRNAMAGDMESRAESIRMELRYTVSVKELRGR